MSATAVRILGIDPGLARHRIRRGRQARSRAHLRHERLHSNPGGGELCPSGWRSYSKALGEVIAAHRPREVALEKVFVNVNPASTLRWDRRAARRSVRRYRHGCRSPNTPRSR